MFKLNIKFCHHSKHMSCNHVSTFFQTQTQITRPFLGFECQNQTEFPDSLVTIINLPVFLIAEDTQKIHFALNSESKYIRTVTESSTPMPVSSACVTCKQNGSGRVYKFLFTEEIKLQKCLCAILLAHKPIQSPQYLYLAWDHHV